MRVLHLETGRHIYGGAGQVLHLIGGLADLGVESTLVCPVRSDIATAARDRRLDVITVPMAGDLDLSFVSRFRRLIRQTGPDLVHVHSRRGADTLGGLGARLAGVPSILSRRVDSPDLAVLGSLKYGLYARVIAISDAIRRKLARQGVPAAKLRLVRSGIDPTVCAPTWPRDRFLARFNFQEGDIPVAVVAQFIERKGHRHLLAAFGQLRRSGSRVRAILFGAGPLAARIERKAAEQGLASSVECAGYCADLLEFLGHFEMLVHPAVREGLGVSLLEAQAAGVPVIGFRAGGVIEAIADGETGILVPKGDSAALAAAIDDVATNPARRQEMAAAARDRMRDEFSLERMVCGNLDVYSEVLDGGPDETC